MLISIQPDELLRRRKLYCLERIAHLDLSSVLPIPPPEMLQDRGALLKEEAEIEIEFDRLGVDLEARDVSWMAQGFWMAADANEE